jgi:hypothetical protein
MEHDLNCVDVQQGVILALEYSCAGIDTEVVTIELVMEG